MDSKRMTRIMIILTLLGSVYMLGTLVLRLGWVGIAGTLISFLVVGVAFILWSRVRGR